MGHEYSSALERLDRISAIVSPGSKNLGDPDEELIPKNIERIVKDAIRKGLLNELGMRSGFPSDEHAAYTRNVWTDRRSWGALIDSVLALVGSLIALISND